MHSILCRIINVINAESTSAALEAGTSALIKYFFSYISGMVVVVRWKKKLTEEKEDEMELDNMERVYVVNIPNLPQYKKKIW